MAEYLDSNMPIAYTDPDTEEIKASIYFEDYLFNLVKDIGGENGDTPIDISQVLSTHQLLMILPSKISSVEKRIDDLTQLVTAQSAEIAHLRSEGAGLNISMSTLRQLNYVN